MDKEDLIIEQLRIINEKLDKLNPNPYQDAFSCKDSCPKCGLQLRDDLGGTKILGYVCSNHPCPCGLGGTIC